MKVLTLANQKGGVGKSAIATQFAHYLRSLGFSVLVIDLDHQQNTSAPLRLSPAVTTADFSSSALFSQDTLPVLPAAPFVLIGGDDRLSMLEREASRHNAYANRFRAALKAYDRFDVCIVDTNPNPDIRYATALICASHVLAPVQLNQEAIAGISALLGHPRYGVKRIQASLNPGLTFLGILPNLVEPTPFQRGNFQALAASYGSLLLSQRTEAGVSFGYIQKRTAIAEAQAAGQFVADLPKTSARDAWRDIKPVFEMIAMGLGLSASQEMPA
jgi:chromosome partitioning protein